MCPLHSAMARRIFLSLLPLLLLTGVSSAADLKEGVEQLAAAIAKSVPEGKQLRVAVTDFPDLQGVTSDLGRYIAERLTTRLAQTPKFRVIERRRLGQVLAELRFGMSDLVDPAKAKQLGRLAGVEALVVGSLSDLGNTVEVDARIIEIETSNMLVAATTSISKDDTVKTMQERGREMPAPPSVGAAPGGAPTVAAPRMALGTLKYQEFPKFRVEVEGLQIGAKKDVTVFLTYVNKTQEELEIMLSVPKNYTGAERVGRTFVVDNVGNRYDYQSSSGLSGYFARGYEPGYFGPPLTLPPGGRITTSFFFSPDRDMERQGNLFSFTSEQGLVKMKPTGRGTVIGLFNITIRNIEPR